MVHCLKIAGICNGILQVSETIHFFHSFFFFPPQTGNLNGFVFKFTDFSFSASSNITLNAMVDFSFQLF